MEKKNSITKQFVLSTKLAEKAENRSSDLGITFPEYLRYLIVQDTSEIPMVDAETEESIAKSLDDYKNGRYTELKTKEEFEKHFRSIANKATKN